MAACAALGSIGMSDVMGEQDLRTVLEFDDRPLHRPGLVVDGFVGEGDPAPCELGRDRTRQLCHWLESMGSFVEPDLSHPTSQHCAFRVTRQVIFTTSATCERPRRFPPDNDHSSQPSAVCLEAAGAPAVARRSWE